jgi:hypothetical protein
MVNIRAKGQNGEREAAALLSELAGIDLARTLGQSRDGGEDIAGIPGICVEVKRHETLNVNGWWKQVCRAADSKGELPVLMYRRNREAWSFCVPAYLLTIGSPGYITMGSVPFAFWLRKWLHD